MDFRSLLQSMNTIAEGETKETEKGRVHKGEYGNKYGKEDVRDQYGHKIGKKDKGEEAKKDAPKKGRGRPKKDVGDAGEKFDTSTLSSVMGGKKPKKEVGKVSKKHSLKEYMESVEATKAEQLDEGVMDWAKEKYHDYQTGRQWNKFFQAQKKGDQTGMQAAQDAANVHKDKLQVARLNRTGSTLAKNSDFGRDQDRANIASLQKRGLVPQNYGRIEEEGMGEAEQVTIAPAQTNTQVIKQGDRVLGQVTNPQLASTIKSAIGKGEMSLANTNVQMDEDNPESLTGLAGQMAGLVLPNPKDAVAGFKKTFEKAPPGAKAERMVKHIKKGYAKDGKLTPKEKSIAYATAWKAHNKGKIEESISLNESPATLQHIISRFKNEVKRFVNGDELDHDLYEALYDYYMDIGEIPYGTAKGRTGDPYEWVTQRFEQDVQAHVEQPSLPLGRPAVDENAMRDFTQHALKEPTSSFQSKDDTRMAVPRGTPTKLNRPVEEPTPWGTDPIAAATDRAFNFVSSLGKGTKFTKEGKEDMKDIQVESWEKQLNGLLTEGITVSSSQGQQGSPDSVSITATDNDAQTLMGVLRNAGIGGFGADTKPEIGYGVAQGGEEEATGTGTEPQPAPDVVGDGDDMLALIKKLTGMGDEAHVVAVGGDEEGQDYEDEEGEEPQTLEPADSGEDDGKEELTGSEDDSEEKTDEGNKFTGNLAKARAQGKTEADLDGDGDMEKVKEDDVEEGNKFTGNLAKARAAGKSEADLDGDGDMEKVHEGEEEVCNECGGAMYEGHSCGGHEQVEENFANDAGGDAMADTELAKLKALLSMGNDLHKMKADQTVGNPTRVSVRESLNEWKKLSGIK